MFSLSWSFETAPLMPGSPSAPTAIEATASHGPTPPHREVTGHHRNGSDASPGRGQSPRWPSSRSSSTSIDGMLIEASSAAHDGRYLPFGQYHYPPPPPHLQTHHTHPPHPPRSPSPTQSPATRVEMYPGPGQCAGMHSYQTHIFVPPVRKSNTSTGMASSLSRGGGLAVRSRYRNQFSILC